MLFCDVVGSTALAGRLDPEAYHEVVRAYHQTCAAVVQRFDGYVAQYLGDGVLVIFGPIVSPPPAFVRGDANADGSVNLADAVFVLSLLFAGAQRVPCQDAADSDDDGAISITDGVYLFNYLFRAGSPEPPAPFPEAGEDPTPDMLGCAGR